jgi:hypothetical protein
MKRNILLNQFVASGAKSLKSIKHLSAMTFVKRGLPLVNHILRMLVTMGVKVNTSWVKVIITFLSHCNRLRKNAGMRMLVIYLKAASVSLQQASGGMRLRDMGPLGTRFARTGSGIPSVIPVLHRVQIRRGNPTYIQFWLTLFNLYRILEIPVKAKLNTITSPSTMDPNQVLPALGRFIPMFVYQLATIIGFRTPLMKSLLTSDKGPLWLMKTLRAVPFLISKSAPSVRPMTADDDSPVSTSPASLIYSAKAWMNNPGLYQYLTYWCQMTGNTYLLNRIESWSKLPKANIYAKGTPHLGKLGFKEEAAGKLRVFAMCDPYTQWLFKPLWDALVDLLQRIPQDGTKDQMAPIHSLLKRRPKGPFFSYDLSAATDRLPVIIQAQLLGYFIGAHAANIWKILLIGRPYFVPINSYKGVPSGELIHYEAGQPMGALTSWGMLAFTHHLMVQWSAYRVDPTNYHWFSDYAVLGDDIVIADKAVAESYVETCNLLGVEIGLAKSLLSPKGKSLEFAKRTFVNSTDVSPVPFKEYWVAVQMINAGLEFASKYKLSAAQFLKIHGSGWRVLSQHLKPFTKMGKVWRNLLLAYISPKGVVPRPLLNYFLSKSIGKVANVRDDIKLSILYSYLKDLISDLQKQVDENLPIWDQVRKLVTVTKYYGKYSSPTAPPIVLYDDIIFDDSKPVGPQKDLIGHITEEINSTVYRTAFMDVPGDVRDIRNDLSEIVSSSEISLDDIQNLLVRIESLFDKLENLPLGVTALSVRKEAVQVRIREFSLVSSWVTQHKLVKPNRRIFAVPHNSLNS